MKGKHLPFSEGEEDRCLEWPKSEGRGSALTHLSECWRLLRATKYELSLIGCQHPPPQTLCCHLQAGGKPAEILSLTPPLPTSGGLPAVWGGEGRKENGPYHIGLAPTDPASSELHECSTSNRGEGTDPSCSPPDLRQQARRSHVVGGNLFKHTLQAIFSEIMSLWINIERILVYILKNSHAGCIPRSGNMCFPGFQLKQHNMCHCYFSLGNTYTCVLLHTCCARGTLSQVR